MNHYNAKITTFAKREEYASTKKNLKMKLLKVWNKKKMLSKKMFEQQQTSCNSMNIGEKLSLNNDQFEDSMSNIYRWQWRWWFNHQFSDTNCNSFNDNGTI